MSPFGYIGIDFGTSNTHFAHCPADNEVPKPETIRLGDSDSQTTCVLWKVPKDKLAGVGHLVEEYGTMALHTWLEQQLDKKQGGHFGFGFKPDLTLSEQARLDAWAFLHKACEEIRHVGLPREIGPTGYTVVVGVPAEVGEEHRRITAEIAMQAGFGEVVCVEEPLGALAYHLNMKHISRTEAIKGVVVVDFGGGTFDVALVSSEGLHEPWGDPTLGGRLFDDLFFQWVSEQSGPFDVDDREALLVWQRECRRLKEDFSNRWRRKGDDLADFKASIKVGGEDKLLRKVSVREFEARARAYRPSHMVRKYLRGLDKVPGGLVIDTPIDLFDRISKTLTRNGQIGSLKGRFSKIILTGGSSHWPFMRRLVAEAFGVDPEKDLLMSQNPETTIGSGLALYHVLKQRNDHRRSRIHEQKAPAKAEFEKAVMERAGRYADELSGAIVGALMPRVEKVYWEWYANGGSLNQVEVKVRALCDEFAKAEAKTLIEASWNALNVDLVRMIRDHLARFLQDNEIPKNAENYIPLSVATIYDMQKEAGVPARGIAGDVSQTAAAAVLGTVLTSVSVIAFVVIASLKGAVLAAVATAVMATPPLWIVAGAAALVLAVSGLTTAVKEKMETYVKDFEFGSNTLAMLKVAFGEQQMRQKLAEGAATTKQRLRQEMLQSVCQVSAEVAKIDPTKKPLIDEATDTFDRLIDAAIKDLGVLDQIGASKNEIRI